MGRVLGVMLLACVEARLDTRVTPPEAGRDDASAPTPEHLGASRAPVRPPTARPDSWSFPEHLGEVPVAEAGPCGDALFDRTVHTAEITLDDASWADLTESPRTETIAGLRWNDGDARLVGLRVKGNASFRTLDEKPSFKIDVHAWLREQRLDGCKRLTLNNMIQDPSFLREHAYYGMARALGRVAPRHAWVDVRVNGAPYGRYALVETLDEQFVARAWPDDAGGNLYEASGADFTPENDWLRLEESGGAVDPPDDLHALVARLAAAPAGDFLPTVDRSFDRDALLDFLALDIVAGNDDGYVFNHHNYLAYHAPRADRWTLVPWGTDRGFTRAVPPQGDLATPTVGDLALRCWGDPACAALLQARVDDIAARFHDSLAPALRALAPAAASACADDPRRELRCDTDALISFVARRRDTLQAGTPPADTAP
jgi:hypothetical protein